MKIEKRKLKKLVIGTLFALASFLGAASSAFAEDMVLQDSITLSPMNQKIILTPGETYRGSFMISSQAKNKIDLKYKVTVEPFYVDENYDIYYSNNGDYNQIVDWTTVETTAGTLKPNTKKEIYFSVKVPKDAPAGGQYLAIKITSDNDAEDIEGGLNLKVKYGIAHIVYAEIAGTTKRHGEVTGVEVPGFLLGGNISATSFIKNTGNVHGTAKYTLQVFPLIGNEEYYTNEEEPDTMTILPDRTLMNTSYWEETKIAGIFRVRYTAEFEGVRSETEKLVIVCPLWLLFIILTAVFFVFIWLFSRSKKRKNS